MQKILVVDDEEVNRELLRSILEDLYEVITAEDGKVALQRMQECHEEVAAVLLDLQMPNADGFAVMEKMRRNGWADRTSVLVISAEKEVAVESRCFELGVSDFIHKPFEPSIVRNRVKNTIELINCKNQLEQKVEQQAATLEEQSQIIRMQAEKLSKAGAFDKLMMEYRSAIMEVETKLKVLNMVFSEEYKRNPFESIKSRLKSPESISKKLERKGYSFTIGNIVEQVADVAGLRVICSFPDDIYRLAKLLTEQDDITLLRSKDYIRDPKPNGYRSLHLILDVPLFLPEGKKYMKVEVQFRTIAMDFWASLEHKLNYKRDDMEDADEIGLQLKDCADSIEELDYRMQEIRDRIANSGEKRIANPDGERL